MRTIPTPILLIAALGAQDAPEKPAALHLPAGDHTVVGLLQLAEQAVRRPIRPQFDDPTVPDARLRLQVDLVVPQHRCHDVLGALLSTRGVVLVHAGADGGLEARPRPDAPVAWLAQHAEELTPAELFARPALVGPVRVIAATDAQPMPLIQGLRAFLSAPRRPLSVTPVDRGIELVGLADDVRFALDQLAQAAPEIAAAMPANAAPPWPRPVAPATHHVARGRVTVVELVDRYATCLGRNIVASPELTELDVLDLPADFDGDGLALEDHVSALLWQRRVLVLPLCAADGLYEAIVLDPGERPSPSRSTPIRAEELKARAGLVALVTCVPTQPPHKVEDLVNAARRAQRVRGTSTLSLGLFAGRVHVTGLSDEVVAMLDALDAASADRDDGKR